MTGRSVIRFLFILCAAAAPARPEARDRLLPRFDPALSRWLSGEPVRRIQPGASDRGLGTQGLSLPTLTSEDHAAALVLFQGSRRDLEALGFSVLEQKDGLAAVRGPREAFVSLAASPQLEFARLSRPVRPTLDRSLDLIHADRVRHGSPPDYNGPTGRGAIVGIVDTGLDIHHEDFRWPDGTTRVLAFWDHFALGTDPEVPLGRIYREGPLNSYLRRRPEDLGFDPVGHGTHVAGIAAGDGSGAGRGVAYRYVGVAPEAGLVVVRTGFDEAALIASVSFVFSEAERRGRPVVVNLSLGHQYGPHDGTDPFERLISEQCGSGRLVCVSGGNDGDRGMHAFLSGTGGADSVSFDLPLANRNSDDLLVVHLEGWTTALAEHEYDIVLPRGARLGPIRPDTEHHFTARAYELWGSEGGTPFGRYFALEVGIYAPGAIEGEWTIVVRPTKGVRQPMHFWIPYANLGTDELPGFRRGLDLSASLGPPANGLNVVAVSAAASKLCWTPRGSASVICYPRIQEIGSLAYFSSLGPTPDGRRKPEVCAPGLGVVSALSASMSPQARDAVSLDLLLDPDGIHWINAGTSMAAPHVTGALALLLAKVPDLEPREAQGRLAVSGRAMESPPGTHAGTLLDLNAFLSPPASLAFSSVEILPGLRARLRWQPLSLSGDPVFRVSRSFFRNGSYEVLPSADRRGRGPHEFLNGPLEPGREYFYRLSTVDDFGIEESLDTLSATTDGAPALALRSPRPSPGPAPHLLSYYLPAASGVGDYTLRVLDAQGRLVRTLAQGTWGPAEEELSVTWDGYRDNAVPAPGGLYVVRLTAGRESRSVKLIHRR